MGNEKAETRKRKYKSTIQDSGIMGSEKTVTRKQEYKSTIQVHPKEVPNTTEDEPENADPKRRKSKSKWTASSYSKVTIPEAEMWLNFRLTLRGIPVKKMLEGKSVLLGQRLISKAKKQVYRGLVNYLKAGGYPTEADPDFKEANINDLVAFVTYPIISLFNDETARQLHISREKEIASLDSTTSGMEEFVVMDYICLGQTKYVLIIEAKRVSLGGARKQCFLSMKDMRDQNGGGIVYGFITNGDSWRMISFDGKFTMSEKIELMFDTMDEDKGRWMADYSILVDCFNFALSNGANDLVEEEEEEEEEAARCHSKGLHK
ncbi:hypothetical protein B9Z19DRAFT_1193558 [Tuber borchii]|uniref:Uncharacterized protein n=1 Tax=Tuber borchii TaxID=42251 RepID=A0A2T6ZRJ3_TUBBO|nr:hypothetical protein B9Z19DRAFT_1193558 [Tuber borchii]